MELKAMKLFFQLKARQWKLASGSKEIILGIV